MNLEKNQLIEERINILLSKTIVIKKGDKKGKELEIFFENAKKRQRIAIEKNIRKYFRAESVAALPA